MPKKYLSVKEKLAYGFGDNGLSISYTIVSFFYMFYLTDVAGLTPSLAGSVVLIGKLWDAITDPLCGYLSDNTKTRWGRRRPFFLLSAIPFGLTFFLLWRPIATDSQMLLFGYNALLFVLFTTSYTLFAVPYMALTPELTPNYDERTSLTAYRMAFSIVAGLLAVAFPMLIVDQYTDPKVGFTIMGAVFGMVIMISPLSVFFGTKERSKAAESSASFFTGVKETLKNKPFLIALAIFLFTWSALDIISAVFMYFIKYWLQIEGMDSLIFALLFTVSVIFLPIWVRYSEKHGKKKTYYIGIGSLIIVLFASLLLQPGQLTGVLIIAALAGIGVSVAHVIPYSILPDCIDFGQWKTGQRLEGVYYGFTTFSRKAATSLSLFVIGQILEFTGYTPDIAQNDTTLWAIRLLLGPGSAILLIIGILYMIKFPITRDKHTEIMKNISAAK